MKPFVRKETPFIGMKNPNIRQFVCCYMPIVGMIGFTLIEMLITLCVAVVLLGIAAPSMSTFLATNRLTGQANDLMADINLARSEAIKRNVQTGVCASASGTSCTTGGNWTDGWLVFADAGGPIAVVRAHEKLSGKNLALSGPAGSVTFTRGGFLSGAAATFQLCDSQIKKLRTVTVIPTGRPDVAEGSC